MNDARNTLRQAKTSFQQILLSAGFEDVHLMEEMDLGGTRIDLMIAATLAGDRLQFAVEAKSLITPRRASAVIQQLRTMPKSVVPVMFAPVISARVATIARAEGIGYFDAAGNCWIRSVRDRLLIERQGLRAAHHERRAFADTFAPRSSRIVRVMLSNPRKGWQVQELAKHPDVQVSQGLAANVKRALLEEGYAIEHRSLLFLRDPAGLLTAWTKKYGGPANRLPLYVRGDPVSAEKTVATWCWRNGLHHAFAGLSAAWRLAPETRYTLATVYVEERGFDEELVNQLCKDHQIKRVASGENLQMWLPFDRSVFAECDLALEGVTASTSPIQTYLDARLAVGRGDDAANAVFDKYLRNQFLAAAEQAKEWENAT